MTDRDHIRNPVEWSVDQLRTAGAAVGQTSQAVRGTGPAVASAEPEVRRIEIADLREVLFGNKLPSLVLNLLSEETLDGSDVAALRAALDRIEAKS